MLTLIGSSDETNLFVTAPSEYENLNEIRQQLYAIFMGWS